jgi:hypothetical protein
MSWTRQTVKVKCLGFDMFVRPRYLGLGWLPSLNTLGLTCWSDSRYLGLSWLPSLSTLGLVCFSGPHHLELGWLSSLSILGLACLPGLFDLKRFLFIKILTKKLTHEKERNNSLMAIEDFHHIQLVLLWFWLLITNP